MAREIVSWDYVTSGIEQLSFTSGNQYSVSTDIYYKCYLVDSDGSESWCIVPHYFSASHGHRLGMLYWSDTAVAVININNKEFFIFDEIQDCIVKLLLLLISIILTIYLAKMNVFVTWHLNIYGYLVIAAYIVSGRWCRALYVVISGSSHCQSTFQPTCCFSEGIICVA